MVIFNKSNKEKSFTLTEMLVVITMIVILTTIIVVGTEGSRALSRDKRRMADLAAYQVALQEYYSYNKAYPFNNCATSDDDWTSCGAPQTVEQCEAMVNSEGDSCTADDTGKYCTCPGADEFLGKLKTPPNNESAFLDPLPKDPKADEDTAYVYVFPLPNNGKNYKIAVPLEKDTQSMANDSGTNPPAEPALYEVFSTLGASLAVDTSFFSGISGNLACRISNSGCTAGEEVAVLRMSAQTNAHAELASESNYSWSVCCSPSNIAVSYVASSGTFLNLSATTNAHVEKRTQSNYANFVSLSTGSGDNIECGDFPVCETGATCLASISDGDTNLHIGDCSAYTRKVCCVIKK